MDKAFEYAREAQLCLEGYIKCKTKLEQITDSHWIFQCEQANSYTIRKSDGAVSHHGTLLCLLALGENERAQTDLLLRLLRLYPNGVELLSEDDEAYYVRINQVEKRGRLKRSDLRVSKLSGKLYPKKGRLWSRKPLLAS